MNNKDAAYRPGNHIRSSGGTAGFVLALLILLGTLINACQDQPVDNTGISIIRDTVVNVRYDTVILNDTDTVIVRMIDTLFIEKHDTIITPDVRWDTVIRYDTISDTVEKFIHDTVTKMVYDTINVPGVNRYRKATLIHHARSDSLNSPLMKLNIDLTEWLQYQVIDSSGGVMGLGLSMSAAIPPEYRRYGVTSLQTSVPFYLRGLALTIPLFRVGAVAGGSDEIPLNRHPFNWLPVQERAGGMMISAQAGDQGAFLQGWTGQVIEGSLQTGGERYQSGGTLRLNRLNMNDKIIFAQIQGTIFVATEINARQVVERFEIMLELELGY